jgi:hypothetical protein
VAPRLVRPLLSLVAHVLAAILFSSCGAASFGATRRRHRGGKSRYSQPNTVQDIRIGAVTVKQGTRTSACPLAVFAGSRARSVPACAQVFEHPYAFQSVCHASVCVHHACQHVPWWNLALIVEVRILRSGLVSTNTHAPRILLLPRMQFGGGKDKCQGDVSAKYLNALFDDDRIRLKP